MIIFLKLAALLCLVFVSYQDCKERSVYWFLFPALATILGGLHMLHFEMPVFGLYVAYNIVIISVVLLLLYGYTRFIQKTVFLNTSFGLGDLLFFYAFSIGFPTLTFVILFVFSIFFSFLTFFIFRNNMKFETVPLAGLQSIFLTAVLLYSLIFKYPSLYIL